MAGTYSRNPNVEAAPMGDECVIFNPQNNKFCLLNRSASLLWNQLGAPRSTEELVSVLAGHFDGVDRAQAQRDVEDAFKELVDTGCLVQSP